MSHRFTFSLAHLFLLVMLTSMLCVWLPTAAEWNRQSPMDLPGWYLPEISDDGTLFFSNNPDRGFAVFETKTGKCLLSQPLSKDAEVYFGPLAKCAYVFGPSEKALNSIVRYDILAGTHQTLVPPNASSPGYRVRPPFFEYQGRMFATATWYPEFASPGDDYRRHEDLLQCWAIESGELRYSTKMLWSSAPFHSPVVSGNKLLFINVGARDVNATPDGQGTVVQCHDLKTGEASWRTNIDTLVGQISNRLDIGDNQLLTLINRSVAGPNTQDRVVQIQLADGSIVNSSVKIPGLSDTYAVSRDGKFLYALVYDPQTQSRRLWRIDIVRGGAMEILDADTSWTQDLKLIGNDRQLALASRDGTFQVLDTATGKDVFRRTGLRYAPSRTIGYVLLGLGATWCVLWWRATQQQKDQPVDVSRYAGLMVFACGLSIGLLLLGYRGQSQDLHQPTVAVATAFGVLAGIAGLFLLFERRCNKLASGYALVVSATMACYVIWLANQSP